MTPHMADPAADRALLRRFEPIIRYTRGERFFPMDVERYVAACSLWQQTGDEPAQLLIPEGALALPALGEMPPAPPGTVHFLKFIEPLNITELAAYAVSTGLNAQRNPTQTFRPGRGRLARVGYGSRLADALFSFTLLARGRVPGDTAAAAVLAYEKMQHETERYQYYGRVVRRDGWVALHYCFFYAFNNWRSGFFGVNDHESDWEQVLVYLAELPNGEMEPEWVAYASHDFSGDDLRRRWDDPEVEKVGEHPIIYAGAGSHASYFQAGEYLTEIEMPFLAPMVKLADKIQALARKWTRTQRQGEATFNVFRIPFVDYARGEGLRVGPDVALPDQPVGAWDEPILLDDTQGWAMRYRGLWGLYARDPIAGENAPAGPVYNRDGSVRQVWYDPLGWAGLDKVPPFSQLAERLQARRADLQAEQTRRAKQIAERHHALVDLEVDVEAMHHRPHLQRLARNYEDKITKLAGEIRQLRAQQAETEMLLEALAAQQAQVAAGDRGPLRAHLRRAHHPETGEQQRFNRLAEWWAAVSISLMMLGFVALLTLVLFNVVSRGTLVWGLVGMVTALVFVEASFRRQLHRLIPSATIILAGISVLILVFEFFWPLVVLSVLFAGGYLIWENIRELLER